MKFSLLANPVQARQTKQQFAQPDEQLSWELGKAVKELPPLYTRFLAGTISIIVFGAIGWAHFSEVDEVATASGELIASAQVRPVTSLGNGFIVAVKVKEGDRVHKGQVLIERDPDLQQADVTRLAKTIALIQQDLQRLDAERKGVITTTATQLQDQLLASRLQASKARQAAAQAEAIRQAAVVEQAKVRLTRLQDNLNNAIAGVSNAKINLANARKLQQKVINNQAIAQKREQSLRNLTNSGALPRLDYLDALEKLNRARAEITRANDEVTNAQNKLTEAQDKLHP